MKIDIYIYIRLDSFDSTQFDLTYISLSIYTHTVYKYMYVYIVGCIISNHRHERKRFISNAVLRLRALVTSAEALLG